MQPMYYENATKLKRKNFSFVLVPFKKKHLNYKHANYQVPNCFVVEVGG